MEVIKGAYYLAKALYNGVVSRDVSFQDRIDNIFTRGWNSDPNAEAMKTAEGSRLYKIVRAMFHENLPLGRRMGRAINLRARANEAFQALRTAMSKLHEYDHHGPERFWVLGGAMTVDSGAMNAFHAYVDAGLRAQDYTGCAFPVADTARTFRESLLANPKLANDVEEVKRFNATLTKINAHLPAGQAHFELLPLPAGTSRS